MNAKISLLLREINAVVAFAFYAHRQIITTIHIGFVTIHDRRFLRLCGTCSFPQNIKTNLTWTKEKEINLRAALSPHTFSMD
jgi:hypothetical protein